MLVDVNWITFNLIEKAKYFNFFYSVKKQTPLKSFSRNQFFTNKQKVSLVIRVGTHVKNAGPQISS